MKKLRKEIDNRDKEIMSLLDKRFEVVSSIKKYKEENDVSIEDITREKEILLKINDYKNSDNIKRIYQTIITESKINQY
ncbi:MAG: chorismate mutase [Mycoplasmatales bacterium]